MTAPNGGTISMVSIADAFVERCDASASLPPFERARAWCEASKAAHVRLWVEQPPPDEASRLLEALEACLKKFPDVPKADSYKRHVKARIVNVNQYIKGELPIFPLGVLSKEEEERIQQSLKNGNARAMASPPESARWQRK